MNIFFSDCTFLFIFSLHHIQYANLFAKRVNPEHLKTFKNIYNTKYSMRFKHESDKQLQGKKDQTAKQTKNQNQHQRILQIESITSFEKHE